MEKSCSHAGEKTDKVKVLFFISSLEGGGAERVLVDILRHIDRAKFAPTLVLLYPYENSPYREYLPADIPVVVVGRQSDSFIEKIGQFLSFMQTVFKEDPQVILSKLTHNNLMAILAGKLFNIKVIVCEHNTLSEVVRDRDGKYILGVPVSPMVKILYRSADRIVAICEKIKENLIEDFHIPADKISVIRNPLDMARIEELGSIRPRHPFFDGLTHVVMAAGRMVPQKGFDILLKAFSQVVSEVEARMIIMGEGPDMETLKQTAQDLGIAGEVSFTGFQENPYQFMSHADVYVLSSRYEGMPMVVLESMACGLPVIATDCRSGIREMLNDGECGMLVPAEDPERLAGAIVRLIKDRPAREELSVLAKQRVGDFSADKILKQYEDLISSQL